MRMNLEALKTLELKLAEYSKSNGTVAEHESLTNNSTAGCNGCHGSCIAACKNDCQGSCDNTSYGAWHGDPHGKHK